MPSKTNDNAANSKDEGRPKVKRVNRSTRAGLQFPVGRIHKKLKIGNYARRISFMAAVYLTAALEYLSAEILELAGNAANDNRRSRISPRHILLAIRHDIELDRMLHGVIISQAGYFPRYNSLPTLQAQAQQAATSHNATTSSQEQENTNTSSQEQENTNTSSQEQE